MTGVLVGLLQRLLPAWFPPHHTQDPRLHRQQYTRHGLRIVTRDEVERELERVLAIKF